MPVFFGRHVIGGDATVMQAPAVAPVNPVVAQIPAMQAQINMLTTAVAQLKLQLANTTHSAPAAAVSVSPATPPA